MKRVCRLFSLLCAVFLLFNVIIVTEVWASPQETQDLDIKAKSAVLMEVSTGKILYEQNSHEKLLPASVTKVMTMLLIMEALENNRIALDDIVTTSEYAAGMGGSQVYLAPGEQMSLHDMLKAIAVASGNDASVAMAEHIYGSEDAFVKAMNERAKELGMHDTHFMNSNGLDEENHFTSAHDIALMSRELLKYPKIHEYLNIWMDSLRDGEFELVNTNKLVKFYKGANGIKTGSTSKALYCLAASAEREGMQLVAAIMAAPTSAERFRSASKLLDYGFANYMVVTGAGKGEQVGDLEVLKGMSPSVKLETASDFALLVEKGKQGAIDKAFDIADNVEAPVEKGQKSGEIIFSLNGEEIGRVNVVTAEAVEKITVKKVFSKMFLQWMNVKE